MGSTEQGLGAPQRVAWGGVGAGSDRLGADSRPRACDPRHL